MISREELYQLVWTEPMVRIAEQFNVSGSYLARICTLLNVPRPARGYWAKLAVGKAPAQTPLPEAQPGDPLHWSQDGESVAPVKPKAPPRRRSRSTVRIARDQLHGLIRGARIHFENGRPVDDDAYLKPYKKLLVDVTASKACLDKALNLANDLFNGLESAGHRVILAPPEARLGRGHFDEREVASSLATIGSIAACGPPFDRQWSMSGPSPSGWLSLKWQRRSLCDTSPVSISVRRTMSVHAVAMPLTTAGPQPAIFPAADCASSPFRPTDG
ncbi:MAG: hypothetical protein ACK4VY_02385 [Brevundimonas sp.]